MVLGWYTDNPLSKIVLQSIAGIEIKHINSFDAYTKNNGMPEINIFYGILRGCARAMHLLSYSSKNYYYIDNGYFDAIYVDRQKYKNMSGKFRVVKNAMHEAYPENESILYALPQKNLLVIPPSPYSANFYDTTPEDWTTYAINLGTSLGWEVRVRHKDSTLSLDESLGWCTGVLAFNSMAIMRAIEMEKVVCDTHGILRNEYRLNTHPGYEIKDMKKFYEPKQFTLEEFKQGKCVWN